jgi:hypothetical protein
MDLKGRIETTNFKEFFAPVVSIQRTNTAYSTNGVRLKQTVRWLKSNMYKKAFEYE